MEDYKKMKKNYVCPKLSMLMLNSESVLNVSGLNYDNDIADGEFIWE